MKRFENKVAIVTGSGQGIGLEIAKQLHNEGAKLVINDIDSKLLNEVEIENCIKVAGDCCKIETIEAIIAAAIDNFGEINILVANAGITTFGDFFEYKPEYLNQLMEVNLFGTFFLSQKCAIEMRKRGNGGRIILISSVTGHLAHKNLVAYGMTKAAIEQLAKNLVVELSPYQITINTVAPGATLTERTLLDEDYHNIWSKITPMGKPAEISDIANAVLFFADEKARHITGQCIVVDGGWTSVGTSPY